MCLCVHSTPQHDTTPYVRTRVETSYVAGRRLLAEGLADIKLRYPCPPLGKDATRCLLWGILSLKLLMEGRQDWLSHSGKESRVVFSSGEKKDGGTGGLCQRE